MYRSPSAHKPGSRRMIWTLIGFVSLLCLGVAITVFYLGSLTKTDMSFDGKKASKITAKTFYKTIGNAPARPLKRAKATNPLTDKYTLEFKVANSRGEAERIIDLLREMGVKAHYTPLSRGGHVVYRIRQGIYSSRKIAQREAIALRAKKDLAARVIKLR